MNFTTHDRDNDQYGAGNCAVKYQGAWWYGSCHHSNLNGLYLAVGNKTSDKGMNWWELKNDRRSMKKTEMKLRPAGF
jgi:ficolin